MSRSLPGRYQLSFRDNVSDVSIPFPVLVYSPHWRRYNSLEDRTNDILAPLFSLCPPLKDSIMCNPMPRHNTTSLDPFTVSDNLKNRIAIHQLAYVSLFFFFCQATHLLRVAWARYCNWSVKSFMPEGCIWESDDPSQFLSAAPALDQESGQLLSVTAEIGLLATSCCVPDSQGAVDSLPSSKATSLKRHFLLFPPSGLH